MQRCIPGIYFYIIGDLTGNCIKMYPLKVAIGVGEQQLEEMYS